MAKNVTEFSFKIEDRPGALAALAEVFGKKGINIEAFEGVTHDGKGVIHLVADREDTAAAALKEAHVKFESRKVFELKLQNKPGEIAKLSRALADEGVNISTLYLTMHQTQILSVDKADAASKVLQKLGL